jgi:DNA-binding transcriptional MerR regulator
MRTGQSKRNRLMKISQAARLAGVSPQTVEYYVMLGLIEPVIPPGTRRRFFDRRLVSRIRLIHELNDSGYTLREIRTTWLRRR